jgi:hypothetical protein
MMAKKLKTYQTSLGFFEQAIAAPSMKATFEAWGADSNLFHQGGRQGTDPDVIAATMERPGSDKAADREVAPSDERERQRREPNDAREKAARERKRERSERAVERRKWLYQAEKKHTERAAALRTELEAIEKKVEAEDVDWNEVEKRLKAALRRARD